MNQQEALKILNKEKNYEDEIAKNLDDYFLDSLDTISGLGEEEKQKIKTSLKKIIAESIRHKEMFISLIDMVLENGNSEY